jgi:thymidylate synthase
MVRTYELENLSFEWYNIPNHLGVLQKEVGPNLPWAEDHFQERVSGDPLNPGEQYKNWPWYKQGVEDHKLDGKFSHTYMERYWPKTLMPGGIRFRTGDLGTLVRLLVERPHTRQAYLPIYFPEDLGASSDGHRVPCSLGYHFLIRESKLMVVYHMRSCDWYRYFRDDVYMTVRLGQWVAEKLEGVVMDTLTMHISNLHIFADEFDRLERDYKADLGTDWKGDTS